MVCALFSQGIGLRPWALGSVLPARWADGSIESMRPEGGRRPDRQGLLSPFQGLGGIERFVSWDSRRQALCFRPLRGWGQELDQLFCDEPLVLVRVEQLSYT